MSTTSTLRIGVLVPQGNSIHEREFARLSPAGVSCDFRGFSYPPAGSATFCDELISQMAAPMRELCDDGAQAILVGCTTASMRCASDRAEIRLQQIAGVPVLTAASASCAAANALGISSVSVATPYGASGNLIVRDYLESQGVKVSAIEGLSLDRSPEIWATQAPALTPQQLLELALRTDSSHSQGLYLPCTGIGSLDAIAMFEDRTGKPAFSSVQAGFWATLRHLGRDARQSGGGKLLEQWSFGTQAA